MPCKNYGMSKKKIAFLTGGYSGEAVISYKSAITIENNLDREKYDVYKIDITLPAGGTKMKRETKLR